MPESILLRDGEKIRHLAQDASGIEEKVYDV